MIVSKENSLTECYLGRLFLVQLCPLWTLCLRHISAISTAPQNSTFAQSSPLSQPGLLWGRWTHYWSTSLELVTMKCSVRLLMGNFSLLVCLYSSLRSYEVFFYCAPCKQQLYNYLSKWFWTALMTLLRHVLLYSLIFLALSKVCEIWKV